ncbi:MAG TPA: lysylphosphatidylglycerol synthase domain-containing protein [Pirellulales bacterium]|nr:lysylphosphatidylglycerol synthase domain-containing protein [Pirellulales bacterium]
MPTIRKWLFPAAKLCLVALVAWGIHRTASSAWETLHERHWNPSQLHVPWLLLAAVLGLLGMLPPGLFWHRVLVVLGQPAQRGEALRAYYVGNVGKYVPGKAMVIVLRAGLLRAGGTTATAATVAVFYETLTTMAAGMFWTLAVLSLRFPGHWNLVLPAAGLLAVVGLPTVPYVFRRLARLTGARKLDPAMAERLDQLGFGTVAAAWTALGFGWLSQGAGLWATLAAGGHTSSLNWLDQVLICTAAMALAVVAGFLSFVPGGLVVREALLLELLSPWFGRAGALIAAVLVRLVGIAGELVIAGALYWFGPRPRDAAANAATDAGRDTDEKG